MSQQAQVLERLPAHLTPAQVARAAGLTRRQAIRALKHAGILERHGERFWVAERRLQEALPELWERVHEALVLGV